MDQDDVDDSDRHTGRPVRPSPRTDLHRLVARGHAERRSHPGDGRRTEVVITPSGRLEVFQRLAPMFAALAALDAGLGDDERVVVERYLRGATAAMRALM